VERNAKYFNFLDLSSTNTEPGDGSSVSGRLCNGRTCRRALSIPNVVCFASKEGRWVQHSRQAALVRKDPDLRLRTREVSRSYEALGLRRRQFLCFSSPFSLSS